MIVGETYDGRATFTDAAEQLYNPDSIDIDVISPSGMESTVTPTEFSTGIWDFDVLLDEPGFWWIEVLGVGPNGARRKTRTVICAQPALVDSLS